MSGEVIDREIPHRGANQSSYHCVFGHIYLLKICSLKRKNTSQTYTQCLTILIDPAFLTEPGITMVASTLMGQTPMVNLMASTQKIL